MEYSLVIATLLCMIIQRTLSWCPPHTSLTTSPVNSISQPRALHDSCCQGKAFACGCGDGLQCCPNVQIDFLCITDPCDPNPCGNGICATDVNGRRRCFCSVGTIKDRNGLCMDDPCFRNPCGRGGRCTPRRRRNGGYRCKCSGDQIFDGKTCTANTCDRLRCGAGSCRINRRQAICDCLPGFTFDGRSCVRVDPCVSRSCGAGGRCVGVSGRAVCRCNQGFVLDGRTGDCIQDDPCTRVNCGRGTCSRSGLNAVCSCETGFKFDRRASTCVFDDPCERVTCGRGRCRLDQGQAVCDCDREFIFDQRRQTCIFVPTTTTTAVTRAPPPARQSQVVPASVPFTALLGGRCSGSSCTCDVGFLFDRSSVTCQVTNPCEASTTLSTFELGDSGSEIIAPGMRAGCLKSRNFPLDYPRDFFDEVVIPTAGFSTLAVVIQDMELQISGPNSNGFVQNNCFDDFLFIGGQIFCGSLDNAGTHRVITIDLQGRPQVVIGMIANENTEFRGFLLKWELS